MTESFPAIILAVLTSVVTSNIALIKILVRIDHRVSRLENIVTELMSRVLR
jgi:hypothetical protein